MVFYIFISYAAGVSRRASPNPSISLKIAIRNSYKQKASAGNDGLHFKLNINAKNSFLEKSYRSCSHKQDIYGSVHLHYILKAWSSFCVTLQECLHWLPWTTKLPQYQTQTPLDFEKGWNFVQTFDSNPSAVKLQSTVSVLS